MAWVYLVIAGIMEWGWPVGLKYAWTAEGFRFWPAVGAGLAMLLSGVFLLLAQRTIPMGTAYAVWTGIGAVGTFVLGILLFKEPAETTRFVCVGLIVLGIVGLKLASPK
jgi:quaternary ammonium compound-resistance protein SugE